MKRKTLTIILALTLTLCISLPVFTFGDTAEGAMTQLTLNTTSAAKVKTVIPCTDPLKVTACVTAPSDGLLDVSSDAWYFVPKLYTDPECTSAVKDLNSEDPAGLWKTKAGTVYYLHIAMKGHGADEAMDKESVSVTASFATASDITITDNDNRLYALGMDETTYVQYTPSKTGVYSIPGSPTICNASKESIMPDGKGNSYGLKGNVTYYFKYGKGFADSYAMIYPIKPESITINQTALTMKIAGSLKPITIKHKYSSNASIGFISGTSGNTQWIKLKLSSADKIYMLTTGLGLHGNFKAYLYNSSGKLLASDKTARAGGYIHTAKEPKGTYYLKVVRTQSNATGVALVQLIGGSEGMGF